MKLASSLLSMGLAIQAIVSVGGSLPSLQDEYYAVCGRGTGCSEGNIKLDVASERHEVRCCSAVKLNGWTKRPGCSVWGESKFSKSCYEAKTHFEATTLCSQHGGRLCTRSELEDQCTRGTGCGHDWDLIWSSTLPSPVKLRYAVCGRGVGVRLKDCREGDEILVAASSLHEVRCCSDVKKSNYQKKCGLDVWGASKLGNPAQCHENKSFDEAEALCRGHGGRLCTKLELESSCTKGTGCGHDADMIWSSTSSVTEGPTDAPLAGPTPSPTLSPTRTPSLSPSLKPTPLPSPEPSSSPSSDPSAPPTRIESTAPSNASSSSPSQGPSSSPSSFRSSAPSTMRSFQPSLTQSAMPSLDHSGVPSAPPSKQPTLKPSHAPSLPPATLPPTSTAQSCPESGTSLALDSLNGGGNLTLYHSDAGTLCTLSEIRSYESEKVPDQVIPLARSYESHMWEASAGPAPAALFRESPITCSGNTCSIQLSALNAAGIKLYPSRYVRHENYTPRYVLTAYTYTLSNRDQAARFLERTTFGVTPTELDVLSARGKLSDDDRAQYVRNQMDLDATSHREWWRKRTNPSATHSGQNGRTDHPCDPYSRWRRYPFVRADRKHLIHGYIRDVFLEFSSADENLPEPVIFEAEDASYSGYRERTDANNSGSGYLAHRSNSGSNAYVEWTVTVDEAGSYPISIRYANGDRSNHIDRPFAISINGSGTETIVSGKFSFGFDRWGYTPNLNVNLNVGTNTIKARTVKNSGANIDHLRIGRIPAATLKIDGHARTFFSNGIKDSEDHTYSFREGVPYEICNWPESPNVGAPFGRLNLRRHDNNRCVIVDAYNFELNFEGESYPGSLFEFPTGTEREDWIQQVDEIFSGSTRMIEGQDYLLVNGLSGSVFDDMCGDIASSAELGDAPVLGRLPDGSILMWTPQLVLEENSPENILPDGGGETQLVTGGVTKCANVPRNPFNEESCTLSTMGTACTALEPPIEVDVTLNEENIKTFFDLTQRYVYAIKGLIMDEDDAGTLSPCYPGRTTRWVFNEATCENATALSAQTRAAIEFMLSNSGDENPYMKDVTFPEADSGYSCASNEDRLLNIEIQIGSLCYAHVHPHLMNVYDVTEWTKMDAHPGNAIAATNNRPNPIKMWAEDRVTYPGWYLTFPSEHETKRHPMMRWDTNSYPPNFILVRSGGGQARFGDVISFRDLSDEIKTDEVAAYFGAPPVEGGAGVLICGSEGEIANDPSLGAIFASENPDDDVTGHDYFNQGKAKVWTMIALFEPDQLRQRMAWALSQILVVVASGIDAYDHTEIYLTYYDIMVRNAFGNYRDILKEVSYSPLTAEHLSYLASKSHAYVFEDENKRVTSADENYAREIMQLFTMGLFALNDDGTPKMDKDGKSIQCYDNDAVTSYARAWTGFQRQRVRGNVENDQTATYTNRIDPMKIEVDWRDRFPKTDLSEGYIGDGYPLCVDLPEKMFLKKGAIYRLLGSNPMPELQEDNFDFKDDRFNPKRFVLDDSSPSNSLYHLLHNGGTFLPLVKVGANLPCQGDECLVDTVRVVQVLPGIFYEYVRPACVEQGFYAGVAVSRRSRHEEGVMCANPALPYASEACCNQEDSSVSNPGRNYLYEGERMSFAFANDRCNGNLCTFARIDSNRRYTGYHWTTSSCDTWAKVNSDGHVAIVHNVDDRLSADTVPLHVSEESLNYFKVYWGGRGEYPSSVDNDNNMNNNCGGGKCRILDDGSCLCQTNVVNEQVFYYGQATPSDILSSLSIGAMDPSVYGSEYSPESGSGFVAHVQTPGVYDGTTIFEVVDPVGRKRFLKNIRSTVKLQGWEFPRSLYEAEGATQNGCSFGTRNDVVRHTGSGWLNCEQRDFRNDGFIEWTVDVPKNAEYNIAFRYSFRDGNRPVTVTVNGQVVQASLAIPGTGYSTSYWIYSDKVTVTLMQGENRIRISTSDDDRGPVVDHLLVEGLPTTHEFLFPNPPHFMGLLQDYVSSGIGETNVRDAQFETDAVLDSLFFHESVAPFLCIRVIQRFGISNPSPRYVKECTTAFRNGKYGTFGSETYGDLTAMTAAIVLDREANTAVLDMDAGYGALREPILKLLSLMRAQEYQHAPLETVAELWKLRERISQEPHEFPSVFSFYLPEYIPDSGPAIASSHVAPEAQLMDMPIIIDTLNGLFSTIKYGLSDCIDISGTDYGFAKYPGYGSCNDNGAFQRATGVLGYEPTSSASSAETIDDLATLLTAGRLSSNNRRLITAAYDAFQGDLRAKLRYAQQLIVSSSEFHSTVSPKHSDVGRPAPSGVSGSTGDYKAVIYLFFSGGADTFNMLTPYSCPNENDVYAKYKAIRQNIALSNDPVDEELLEILANNDEQPCNSFGIHSNLPLLQTLYDQSQALFVANAGLLSEPMTRSDYKQLSPVQLFAHNHMQRESKRVDANEEFLGTGVIGRMRDVLNRNSLKTGAYSIDGNQIALIGNPGESPPAVIVSKKGLKEWNPEASSIGMRDTIEAINNATTPDNGFVGETWSMKLTDALEQQEQLYTALQEATVITDFPQGNGLADQLKLVSQLMQTHEARGVRRDVFYVSEGSWDTHSNVIESLKNKFSKVNSALDAFQKEVDEHNLWESTTLVQFSEFARTLSPNSGPSGNGSGAGSDHAWGGNQFMMGGSLNGGKILGSYPSEFDDGSSSYALDRGRMVPTTPWDAMWNGVAQWMGVSSEEDLDEILPMRKNFDSEILFDEATLFE